MDGQRKKCFEEKLAELGCRTKLKDLLYHFFLLWNETKPPLPSSSRAHHDHKEKRKKKKSFARSTCHIVLYSHDHSFFPFFRFQLFLCVGAKRDGMKEIRIRIRRRHGHGHGGVCTCVCVCGKKDKNRKIPRYLLTWFVGFIIIYSIGGGGGGGGGGVQSTYLS